MGYRYVAQSKRKLNLLEIYTSFYSMNWQIFHSVELFIENKYMSAGDYEYKISAPAKGIYFLRMIINETISTQKIIKGE